MDTSTSDDQDFASLVAQLSKVCRESWTTVSWSNDIFSEAIAAAGRRLCKRLEKALQRECILSNASISFDAEGFRITSSDPKLIEAKVGLTFSGLVEELARCCGYEPSRQLGEEFRSCVLNEAMAVLFQKQAWCARDASNLWEFVYKQQCMGSSEAVSFWESFAAFAGHPTHAMWKAKVKVGSQTALSLDDVLRYSPEFQPLVELRLLAVKCDAMVVFPSVQTWHEFWMAHHPEAVQCLIESVGEDSSSGYALLWIHPLNEAHLRSMFSSYFDDGTFILLDDGKVQARPTMSFRTVSMAEGYHMKLPIPLQLTSWPRYVSPVEIQESAIISRMLAEFELPDKLVLLQEGRSCHLSFHATGGAASYEQARYCSMLVRQAPHSCIREGHRLASLAAMFASSPGGRSLFEDFWTYHGIGPAEIVKWFTAYVAVVAECQITPFLRYGFTIEAHQQNALLEFAQDGSLSRLYCRELGGGIEWDLDRLKAFPHLNFYGELYPRQDMFVDVDTCHILLRHTMLQSHLLPLADACASYFHLEVSTLLDIVTSQVRSTIDSVQPAAKDSWSSEQRKEYGLALRRFLLANEVCKCKSLLHMRLGNTKDYMFHEEKNRLSRPAPVL
eukprot:TRINITY_DN11463_c0_g1_i1.p1 TRINITY_DN11463_c0_g1~~TRINITY_DN11463_c0_g1_i1.p1  ORF type:complete len:615 (+),score=65.73 TRINITY_DN11463_c0_g1_i1:40-1884(+)